MADEPALVEQKRAAHVARAQGLASNVQVATQQLIPRSDGRDGADGPQHGLGLDALVAVGRAAVRDFAEQGVERDRGRVARAALADAVRVGVDDQRELLHLGDHVLGELICVRVWLRVCVCVYVCSYAHKRCLQLESSKWHRIALGGEKRRCRAEHCKTMNDQKENARTRSYLQRGEDLRRGGRVVEQVKHGFERGRHNRRAVEVAHGAEHGLGLHEDEEREVEQRGVDLPLGKDLEHLGVAPLGILH